MADGTTELLLHALSDGVIIVDADARITLFNAAAGEILGINHTTAIGTPILDVIPVSSLPDVLATGTPQYEQQLTWGNVTILTSRYPLRDRFGAIVGAAALFRDITEVVRLAEELTNLREIRLLNAAIFESTQDAISVVDERGRGVLVNPAYTRVTGLSQEEVIGQPCTVDIASGESIHMRVLQTGLPVRNQRLRVGPYRRDVVVDANPIKVDGEIRGSVAVIKDVSEIRQLHDQLADARATIRKLEARYTFEDIVGDDAGLQEAVERARVAAGTPATVVLYGESGTGKELFAHAIHNASPRRNARFVRVNCAALADSVLESELFGYEGGAFTGAARGGRRGLFEEAHGGTIFLDEIGLMPRETQTRLLRVLQEREVRRVGGNAAIPINVRVIAATNLDLSEAVRAGSFREDLFYRLSVVPITIPPLRSRMEDIELLTRVLLEKINGEYGRLVREVAPDAHAALRGWHWPGNVRELENVLRRAVVTMGPDETVLALEHLPPLSEAADGCFDIADVPGVARTPATLQREAIASLDEVRRNAETAHIRSALERTGGNRTRAAHELAISVRTLHYKLREYGIS